MNWIAHRGNVYGIQTDKENSPGYILSAIHKGFDVKIDVWWKEDRFYLGHNEPLYPIDVEFLQTHKGKLWVHTRNATSLTHLLNLCEGINVFSRDLALCVMPERPKTRLQACGGICSDYVGWYKQQAEAKLRFGMIIGGRWNCHQTNILPQVREYLSSNPHIWIDIHIVVNDEESKRSTYLQDAWMDAPFIASFNCIPFNVPEHYNHHPKKRPETIAKNAVSMHFTNMKAFESLENYDKYDLVIKYRPDIIAKTFPDIERFLDHKQNGSVIFVPYKHTYCGANDQIAIGSVAAIKEYCNVYPDIDHHLQHNNDYILHPESMLKFHLDKKQIRLQGFDYDYELDNQRKI